MNAYRDQYAQLFTSWARDAEFPYLFASDTGSVVGKQYGAYLGKYKLDNRTLFVIAPDGKINYVAAPFREIDPTSYTTLAAEINRVTGADSTSAR